MEKLLLLADEAIAQGAIDAGLSGVYAYPGTPSTEITQYVQDSSLATERSIHSKWAANEKTAMEAALGMSFVGKRALVCMKHVGLNVAADAFINSAMTGANGGLVVLVADDPSMHSSQNEQDSRFYGKFAFMPMFEPSTQQEAYDIMFDAFDTSEKYKIPVLVRITTRLAHSRAGIIRKPIRQQNELKFPDNIPQWVVLPARARARFEVLLKEQELFLSAAENSSWNNYIDGPDKSKGIIACGIAFNYLMEHFPNGSPFPVIKLSQYPIPTKLIRRMTEECQSILCLEDGFPFVEEQLKGFFGTGVGIPVHGRLDGTLHRSGELNPDKVAKALGMEVEVNYPLPKVVEARPPALCQGCGHRDVYDALNEVVKSYPDHKVFSDIGCYTLGALPPFRSIHTTVDMGASITMAKGAADGGLFPSIAVIGDSTFGHSGITGLLDCVNANSNVTIIISDNETTGMTGGQDSAVFNRIEAICQGVGVDPAHIRVFVPLRKNWDEMLQIIKEEIDYNGTSVIIPRRECIQTMKRKK